MYGYAYYATRDYEISAIGVLVLLVANHLSKTSAERKASSLV
jgi:hypothetical protein